jgi:hypothetical protein
MEAVVRSGGETSTVEVGDGSGLPPLPDSSQGYLPATSESIRFSGKPLDYLPIQVTCKAPKCKASLSMNPPVVGIIDPSGTQHGTSYGYSAMWGQLAFTLMIDAASDVAAGSMLLETDYWKLAWSVSVPATEPFDHDLSVASGLAETDASSFTETIGAKIGGNIKGITGDLSFQLTKSFSHSVTITSQTTDTDHYHWLAKPQPQVVGVYQLMQSFTVVPGANFTQYIDGFNNTPFGRCSGDIIDFCLQFAAGATFVYPTPTYHQATTAQTDAPVLSTDDAAALARSSLVAEPAG